jgi:hypothetical protein
MSGEYATTFVVPSSADVITAQVCPAPTTTSSAVSGVPMSIVRFPPPVEDVP